MRGSEPPEGQTKGDLRLHAYKPAPKRGLAKIIDAARCSFQGLISAYRYEYAFRLELYACLLLLPTALLLPLAIIERLFLIACLLLVLICEILNSAIEAVVDRIGPEHHELSGRAKDLGSAAVFISMLLTALSWGWLCLPLLLRLLD